MIRVFNKRINLIDLATDDPSVIIFDVTSSSPTDYKKLSPFYPHGNIPVPNSDLVSASVEGIWQGLKVFEHRDIDTRYFLNNTMRNLKRSVKYFGKPLGHRYGVRKDDPLLGYLEARKKIYLPSYLYQLSQVEEVQPLIDKLKELNNCDKNIILLDYNINCNINNLNRPLSHAGLIKLYVEDKYPTD